MSSSADLEPALDPVTIQQLVVIDREDPGFLAHVLRTFMDTLEVHVEKLTAAIADQDLEEVQEIAHAVKGSSRQVGALRLGDLFADLEVVRDLKSGPETLNLIRSEVDRIRDEIQRMSE